MYQQAPEPIPLQTSLLFLSLKNATRLVARAIEDASPQPIGTAPTFQLGAAQGSIVERNVRGSPQHIQRRRSRAPSQAPRMSKRLASRTLGRVFGRQQSQVGQSSSRRTRPEAADPTRGSVAQQTVDLYSTEGATGIRVVADPSDAALEYDLTLFGHCTDHLLMYQIVSFSFMA
jgi:hypothetical protein